MTAVYWGRFNPPHKGHMRLIKRILRKERKLVIVVGSAQEKDTKRNPFSGVERVAMLRAYLHEERIPATRARVVALPDGKTYASSVAALQKKITFDAIYTDKKTIADLLRGVTIHATKRTGTISSTKIRDAIAHDKRWEHLTSKSVVALVKKYHGIERVKNTYNKHKVSK